jgi:hypothetical protein
MRPDIAVRIVDINRPAVQGIDWHSPVAKQYHVRWVPFFRVYGSDGKLVLEGHAASDQVKNTLHADLE